METDGGESETPAADEKAYVKGAKMMELIPAFSASGRNNASLAEKQPRKLYEGLNEAVVVIFFCLGPAIGATIFLLWFGGLAWGLLSSIFH